VIKQHTKYQHIWPTSGWDIWVWNRWKILCDTRTGRHHPCKKLIISANIQDKNL